MQPILGASELELSAPCRAIRVVALDAVASYLSVECVAALKVGAVVFESVAVAVDAVQGSAWNCDGFLSPPQAP